MYDGLFSNPANPASERTFAHVDGWRVKVHAKHTTGELFNCDPEKSLETSPGLRKVAYGRKCKADQDSEDSVGTGNRGGSRSSFYHEGSQASRSRQGCCCSPLWGGQEEGLTFDPK